MRRFALIAVLLAGCAEPISNSVFYLDAKFLAPLPSEARFTPSPRFWNAPPSEPHLMTLAHEASRAYGASIRPAVEAGEALRSTSAHDRSDTHRRWEPIPVAYATAQGAQIFWVRGAVALIDEDAVWTVDIARSQDGPWEAAGDGNHHDGMGAMTWNTGGDGITASYETLDDAQRVEAALTRLSVGGVFSPVWGMHGDNVITFNSTGFQVTEDGLERAGYVTVWDGDSGGRGDGVVFVNDDEIRFTACWDELGEPLYAGGDLGVAAVGDPALCPANPVFEADPAQ